MLLWGRYWGLGIFLSLFSASAWAARSGKVLLSDTELREGHDPVSKVILKLKKGDDVVASNEPTEGFHKIRTASGEVGWVIESSLQLEPPPSPEEIEKYKGKPSAQRDGEAPKAVAQSKPLPSDENQAPLEVAEKPPEPAIGKKAKRRLASISTDSAVRIRLLGDYNFFAASGIVNNLSSMGPGYSFGGEFTINLGARVGFTLRGEMMFKTLSLTDSATSKNFQVSVGSIPAMAGFHLVLISSPSFSLQMALLGGVGFNTSLQSANLTDSPPPSNLLTVNVMTFSGLGKVEAHWQISSVFSIFAEGGYRYFYSPLISVDSTSSNGAIILQSSFYLNLSGPMAGGGISFSF